MKKLLLTIAIAAATMTATAQALPVYLDQNADIEARVKDALGRLTLEEKVALCHAQSKFSSAGVRRLGIPELWMSDGPHGVRAEILWNSWDYAGWTNDSITAFPALTGLAATFNPQMATIYGKNLGEEALYREKDVMLGPGVNIYRTPLGGRNFEYMGEDPYLSSRMVVPYIQALQSNGVAACVKHFALNNQEQWRDNIDVTVSERALYEIYLPAFKAAATEGGAWSFMGAYNQIWGEHCCHNNRLLQQILKGEWGFKGAVISDWGGAHDTDQAARNGLDIEMGTATNGLTRDAGLGYNRYFLADPYLVKLRSGEVSMETIDDKAARVLRLIFHTSMNRNRAYGSVCTQAHYDAARTIGNESIVLLKNDGVQKGARKGQKLLPIANDVNSILVVGENAIKKLSDGGGSSELKVKDNVSPLDAMKLVYGDKVKFAEGYRSGRFMYGRADQMPQTLLDSLHRQAVEMAKTADIVVFFGGLNKNAFQDCESTDRREYNLPFGQDDIIRDIVAVNPNLVYVNISGNAVAMDWAQTVPAILQGWYLGSMGGYCYADVLSGKVNPSGKLPFSMPYKLEDCGAHAFGEISYPGIMEGRRPHQEYKEDILVGYRWYDTKKIPARYAFGHGLSYTTFAYSKPRLTDKEIPTNGATTIEVDITNTGSLEGAEVAQLYVSDLKSSLPRPLKELKGFQKVTLKPGETRTVSFTVNSDALHFYDPAQKAWIVEPGDFNLLIGSSSTDIRAKAGLKVK